MKRILFLLLAACTVASSFAQEKIKISAMPTLNEPCDTCWVPVVKGATNYKVRGSNIKSTPTLQQVLTSGSTLTSNHVINGKNNFLEFDSATIFMNTYVEGSYFSSFEMNGNEFILAVGNSEYNFANKIVQNAFETSFSRDITVRYEMAGFDELGVSLIDDNITVGERGLYSNGQIIAVYRNDGIYDYYSFAGDALRISSLTGSADFGFPIFNIAGSNTLGISLKEKSGTYQTGIFEPENDYMIAGYDRGEGSIKYKFANEKFWINESAAVDTAMLGTDLYVQPISGLHGRINLWDADLEVFNVIKATENGFLFSNSVGQFSLLTPIENSIIMQKFVSEASLNFPSTSAQSSSDLTMTVSDAEVGNSVILNITSGTTSYYTAWVSATNTVTVRLNNYGSSAVDPAAQNFTATVIK